MTLLVVLTVVCAVFDLVLCSVLVVVVKVLVLGLGGLARGGTWDFGLLSGFSRITAAAAMTSFMLSLCHV